MEDVNWDNISDEDAVVVLREQHVNLTTNLSWKAVTGILFGRKDITDYEKNKIESENVELDKRNCLVDIVKRKGKTVFKDFVDALSVTGQTTLFNDIVQCLKGKQPDIKEKEEEIWAGITNNDAAQILREQHVILTKKLSWKEVANILYQRRILTEYDKDAVESQKYPVDSRDCLLDVIRRRGKEALKEFVKALSMTKQDALFTTLTAAVEGLMAQKNVGKTEERLDMYS